MDPHHRDVAGGDEPAQAGCLDQQAAAVDAHHGRLQRRVLLLQLPQPLPRHRELRNRARVQSIPCTVKQMTPQT